MVHLAVVAAQHHQAGAGVGVKHVHCIQKHTGAQGAARLTLSMGSGKLGL